MSRILDAAAKSKILAASEQRKFSFNYYVLTYILKSKKTGCYYIGQTEDIGKRLDEHNSRKSRFTKSAVPWELVYSERFFIRSEAINREKYFKSLKSRKNIEKIIAG